MDAIPVGRNFVLVKEEDLPKILQTIESFLPHAIKFHQTIQTYLKDKIWHFYFYISKTWPEDAVCLHFPGCTLTSYDKIYESVGIFCPPDQLDKMSLIETEDILFNWNEPIYMNFTHVGIMNQMDSIFRTKVNGQLTGRIYGDVYIHECHAELHQDLEPLPSNEAVLQHLTLNNVKDIHDLYPAADIESIELFEKLVNRLPGFGVFNKNTHELAAWSLQSYYGGMFSMQTKPEFRRKGYGIQLAQTLTKLVMKRGYIPFVVIRPENNASRSLYTKLGFRKAFESVRGTFAPNVSNVEEDKENEDNLQKDVCIDKDRKNC
ncbi:uncharacterized protein LOC129745146 [Uranotaenia lowii]|uniref:uncharacterized protein LOC129745146 n=1 Tax=Uranotaenia lowii TaxID=190385 RepID=UPI00247A3FFF|nr:uncharacterized protein LOC129745146 [Uranotaenia lowii]XP_055594035.1 uncharacterized protein LOC129745146 [Uranotaenia lowii]